MARYAAEQLGRLGYGDFNGAAGLGLNFSDILRGVVPLATGALSMFDTGGVLPDGAMGPPAPSDFGNWLAIANGAAGQLANILGPGGPSGAGTVTGGPSRPGAPLPPPPLYPSAAPRPPVGPPGYAPPQGGPPSRPGPRLTAPKAGMGIGVAIAIGAGVFLLMGRGKKKR